MPEAVRGHQITETMETEIIQVAQADMLQAINRSEIDIQISTAKTYPRDITRSLALIKTIATLDNETAEDCFYALRRGRGSDTQLIEGVSVRLAEIIAGAWGNLRVATRIVGNDGKTITAQAVCHDLETNLAVSLEVKRRITGKDGKTYSEDMQVMTGNAASAIAFRNAVLKIVPPAVTKRVINDIKKVAMGQGLTRETQMQRMTDYFAKLGVTQKELLAYLGIKNIVEVTDEMVFELRGLANAIKEGTTTVQEAFRANTVESEKLAQAARQKSEEAAQKAAAAMATAKGAKEPSAREKGPASSEALDTQTGEVIIEPADS